MDTYLKPCQNIWEGYKFYTRGGSVIRKGFEHVGVAIRTDDSLDYASTFWRRSESDLEHQAELAWLTSAFIDNFPGYFGDVHLGVVPLDIWLRITTALCHDAGESIIGDILDDGGPEHDTKDEAELAAFKKLTVAYTPATQRELLRLYISFQKKDSYEAMCLVALDKTVAILKHLILESYGIIGRISDKKNPTELDLYYAELAGSDIAADNWGMHMIHRTTKDFPSEIMDPVITLLNVAARDVRGEEFSWLKTV